MNAVTQMIREAVQASRLEGKDRFDTCILSIAAWRRFIAELRITTNPSCVMFDMGGGDRISVSCDLWMPSGRGYLMAREKIRAHWMLLAQSTDEVVTGTGDPDD